VYGYARVATPKPFTVRVKFTAIKSTIKSASAPPRDELLQCPIMDVLDAYGLDISTASFAADVNGTTQEKSSQQPTPPTTQNSAVVTLTGVASTTRIVDMRIEEYNCSDERKLLADLEQQGVVVGACTNCLQGGANSGLRHLPDIVGSPSLQPPLSQTQSCAVQDNPSQPHVCTNGDVTLFGGSSLHLNLILGLVQTLLVVLAAA
jgi:hypothetical protein